ncbi:MAG: hypothetical protein M3299_10820 [Thermoproteota archaeon]|nr:hypothetical protein [Thermoproteota archaeon]
MDTLCKWTPATLQTSGRYGSCEGQRRGPKSASTVGNAIRKVADNIGALICKSIAGKADACNKEA